MTGNPATGTLGQSLPLDMSTLAETLRLAVPMHMAEAAGMRPEHRVATASRLVGADELPGDALIFGANNPKTTARAFNSLARGLAMAAYQPGGVTYLGAHWCTGPHDGCPTPPAPARMTADEGREMWAEFHRHLDDFEALLGPAVEVRRETRTARPTEPAAAPVPCPRRPVDTFDLLGGLS